MSKTYVVSTIESDYFADRLVQNLSQISDLPPGAELLGAQSHREVVAKPFHVELRNFGCQERYVRYDINERLDLFGENIIIVGSTHSRDALMDVMYMGYKASELGANQIIFVIPFYGNATMDRDKQPGEVVTADVHAQMLGGIPNGSKKNVFLFLDLHNESIRRFFPRERCLAYELYAEEALLPVAKKHIGDDDSIGVSSMDIGRLPWIKAYANHLNGSLIIIDKDRVLEDSDVNNVYGVVEGKKIWSYDDLTHSGTTVLNAGKALLDGRADEFNVLLSHLALNNDKIAKLLVDSRISRIIATNSHPMTQIPEVKNHPELFEIRDVSFVFANAIRKVLS